MLVLVWLTTFGFVALCAAVAGPWVGRIGPAFVTGSRLAGRYGRIAAGALMGLLASILLGRPLVALGIALLWLGGHRASEILRLRLARARLAEQVPDCLILIANALKAGFSLFQAMEMVAREIPAPLGAEMGRAVNRVKLGIGIEESLEEIARKWGNEDLELAVVAISIQHQMGGNVTEALGSIAETIRARTKLRGKLKSLTAQGRLSGTIVSLMPVGLGLMIHGIAPDFLSPLFRTELGRFLLVGAAILQLLGFLMIRRICTIDY